jgi:glutamate-1-semialdehyde aminotransferase/acyl carrier protein
MDALEALGRLWIAGAAVDWPALHGDRKPRRVPLPTYPFERRRYWLDPVLDEPHSPGAGAVSACGPPVAPSAKLSLEAASSGMSTRHLESAPRAPAATEPPALLPRRDRIAGTLAGLLKDLSGLDASQIQPATSFFELGFDSLFLTQLAQAVRRAFGVKVSLRQLFDDLCTPAALAEHLDRAAPPDATVESSPVTAPALLPVAEVVANSPAGPEAWPSAPSSERSALVSAVTDHLRATARLLEVLGGATARSAVASIGTDSTQLPLVTPSPPGPPVAVPEMPIPVAAAPRATVGTATAPAAAHGPFRAPGRDSAALTPHQQAHLDRLMARYTARTPRSRAATDAARRHFADPRTVAGFRLAWKEMVYPIVATRSDGARLWDVDGNEYIDFTMGFGTNLLGHAPPFITAAIKAQLDQGIEVGPQSPLAGSVAQLLCELTGMERAAFCNTGSEAVLAAMRVARTVTGRTKIAYFSGDYHGIFDEVLHRATVVDGERRHLPIAPGITESSSADILILDYGAEESLRTIEQYGRELAAVLVEPVQGRRPDLQPREFLERLRALTQRTDTALIFDEVITGFRCHPGGVQGLWNIRADLATYGKIVGGGLPIGVLCGSARYLDTLDGGAWGYGDQSGPEADMTFFAGTYVRHPLVLAASHAMLQYLRREGPGLQARLNERTARLVGRLNAFLREHQVPWHLEHFSSFFWPRVDGDARYSSLLYFHLRDRGIHIFEGRVFFVSTAHTDADLEQFADAFEASIAEMQAGGFLPAPTVPAPAGVGADRIGTVAKLPAASFPTRTASPDRAIPMTESQQGLSMIAHLHPDGARAYTQWIPLELTGPLSVDAVRAALQATLDRHEALRTTIAANGEHQIVHADAVIDVEEQDLSRVAVSDRNVALQEYFRASERQPVDLSRAPVMRARLIRLEAHRHLLLLTFHHLFSNGPSHTVFLKDFWAAYEAHQRGRPRPGPAAMQLTDYVRWRESLTFGEAFDADETYWTAEFDDGAPTLELPIDRPRPSMITF